MRRVMGLVGLLLLLLLTAGCGQATKAPSFATESGKVRVAASLYPIYEFVKAVGGEHVDVVNMVPPGVEPHDWEPKASHIKLLNQAELFIYNGAGLEHWVAKTSRSLDNRSLLLVEASQGFDLLEAAHEDDGHGHGHKHADEEFDPHVWLDPYGVIHQVERIREALIQVDPANQATYEANAAAYIEKLKALDAEFKAGLNACSTRTFFTTHSAFNYLAHRYGLQQHAIMGLAPDAEPTPRTLKRVVEEAKAQGVKYIFFETLASDKVAGVVAKEIGAQTLVLNPFEGLTEAEIAAGKDYISVMRENLTNLRTALECGS